MLSMQLRRGLRAVGRGLPAVIEAAVFLAGGALIAYGAWEAYHPAGPVVGGTLLIVGAILRARGASD